jgi:hypothetical protein
MAVNKKGRSSKKVDKKLNNNKGSQRDHSVRDAGAATLDLFVRRASTRGEFRYRLLRMPMTPEIIDTQNPDRLGL